jgi:hypothetical protein
MSSLYHETTSAERDSVGVQILPASSTSIGAGRSERVLSFSPDETAKRTLWSESARELYRQSDRRLSAK